MEIQNQVSRILRGNLARLRDVLDGAVSQGVGSLGQVADRVCEAFDFRDGRGPVAARELLPGVGRPEGGRPRLAAGGPAALAAVGAGQARVLPHPVAPAVEVPGTVGAVGGLTLVLVETDEQRRVWNTLMAHEHPRGAGPFVGPQLRYLVGSAHGWLGGVGFAASARRLRARDAWVGWDDTGRRANCTGCWDCAGCWCAPALLCRNLASHVLGGSSGQSATTASVGMAIAPGCWRRSSTRPNRRGRACARRTGFGWVRPAVAVARIARHAAPETRKAVYMYALEPAWRERLAVPAPGVAPLAVGDGLDAEVWAEHEFGGARLGDARLSARLVQSAQQMAESPMRAITGAAHGARAMVKGHYRLIDQPADSAVTVDNILAPHRAADAAPDAGARHGAVHPGRHPVELHPARADAGAGGHRLEPDRRRGPRSGAAHDAGRQSRRGGAGRAAGRLRRARARRRTPARKASRARSRARSASRSVGSRGCATARRQPSNCPRPAWCA